jgi:hypothetical protein
VPSSDKRACQTSGVGDTAETTVTQITLALIQTTSCIILPSFLKENYIFSKSLCIKNIGLPLNYLKQQKLLT